MWLSTTTDLTVSLPASIWLLALLVVVGQSVICTCILSDSQRDFTSITLHSTKTVYILYQIGISKYQSCNP